MKEKYKELHVILVSRGLYPQMKRLDNEVSKVLLDFMENDNVDFQLVPAHIHQWNVIEHVIWAWKYFLDRTQ